MMLSKTSLTARAAVVMMVCRLTSETPEVEIYQMISFVFYRSYNIVCASEIPHFTQLFHIHSSFTTYVIDICFFGEDYR